ncbi:MAG: glycerophosphodiester phosphodiesterase [Candidatus Neomarinimicrobiota bacterium]|nr:MAG: glycerophosphodiester phosphodiesterase [Candidatus Neomarinimicrobiota bacterium]
MSPFWTLVLLVVLVLGKFRFLWKPGGQTFPFFRRPLVFGHRGSPRYAPENTLEAYRAALERGADGVEIDVIATRDGEIICSHNFDLERETDGSGFIDESLYADLLPVKTGVTRPHLVPTGLNTLKEVLAALPANVPVNIEVKSWRMLDLQTGMRVARLIRRGQVRQPVLVSSFNPLVVAGVKLVDRNISTGLILEELKWLWTVHWIHPDALHPTAELVTPELIRFAHDRGVRLHVWTVNTRPAMKRLLEWGVDGIFTDVPDLRPDSSSHAA